MFNMLSKNKLFFNRAYKSSNLYKIHKKLVKRKNSPYDNIYHCCTQKSASQWFKAIFSDLSFYKYTGLEVIPFVQPYYRLKEVKFDEAFPKKTIITHLYVDYCTYKKIPKPENYKTFFVLRDPRDLVISWYFSVLYSHQENVMVSEIKKELKKMNLTEGLKYSIEKLEEIGLFKVQKSWKEANLSSQETMLFYYEDLANDNFDFLTQLFQYLDIQMPKDQVFKLYQKNKFEKYTGGRKQGVEDINAHYRKGVSGDWKNYFDSFLTTHFREVTKDLLDVLEYSV